MIEKLVALLLAAWSSMAAAMTSPARPAPQEARPSRSTPIRPTTTTTAVPAAPVAPSGDFQTAEASWYGPGFYGNGTACGQRYSPQIQGVAHKTLACGTMVTFRHNGVEVTVPVIDRGPYVRGRMWDLSAGTCAALGHCFTGQIEYKLA